MRELLPPSVDAEMKDGKLVITALSDGGDILREHGVEIDPPFDSATIDTASQAILESIAQLTKTEVGAAAFRAIEAACA